MTPSQPKGPQTAEEFERILDDALARARGHIMIMDEANRQSMLEGRAGVLAAYAASREQAVATADKDAATTPAEFYRGRLFQFYRMKEDRPHVPTYWDMHEEQTLIEAERGAATPAPPLNINELFQQVRELLYRYRGCMEENCECPGSLIASAVRNSEQQLEGVETAQQEPTPPVRLIKAVRELLSWVPVCSVGSSGHLLRVEVESALQEFGEDGSLKSATGVEADLKHPRATKDN